MVSTSQRVDVTGLEAVRLLDEDGTRVLVLVDQSGEEMRVPLRMQSVSVRSKFQQMEV